MKLKAIITYLGVAVVLVGWGMTWANQNAKINANASDIETIDHELFEGGKAIRIGIFLNIFNAAEDDRT